MDNLYEQTGESCISDVLYATNAVCPSVYHLIKSISFPSKLMLSHALQEGGGKKTCLFNYFNSIALRNPSHSFTPSLEKQGPLLGTQHESLPAAILQLSEKSAISNSYCCNLKVNIPKITHLRFSFFTHILKWKLSYFLHFYLYFYTAIFKHVSPLGFFAVKVPSMSNVNLHEKLTVVLPHEPS